MKQVNYRDRIDFSSMSIYPDSIEAWTINFFDISKYIYLVIYFKSKTSLCFKADTEDKLYELRSFASLMDIKGDQLDRILSFRI